MGVLRLDWIQNFIGRSENSMAKPQKQDREPRRIGIIARPPNSLLDLPFRLRWEVTRRHPYYQLFWKEAARYLRGDSDADPLARVNNVCSHVILGAIGVTGVPPDPALAFEELGAAADDPALLTGSLQPQTFRTTALLLLANLPPSERALLGALMTDTANAETGRADPALPTTVGMHEATQILLKHESAAFDSYPVAPLFYIHVGASQNSFVEDAKRQFAIWRAKGGIESVKVQLSKVEEYLKIWDLREGWTGSGYERARERTIVQIARDRKKPVSTIFNGYRAAFGYIAGREYDPETWFQLFAFLKFRRAFGYLDSDAGPGVSRWLASYSDKPIPSSKLTPVGKQSYVEYEATAADDGDAAQLETEIRDLLERGFTPEQVAANLDLKSVELIRAIADGATAR